ncbi:ABC transporter permease/substrate binding protein [Glaciibacter psychrotolerans]|uniref:Glycine betaine/proline transport system substrate-binding protein n=1 Tax=Glaciibacter psychrotolerans TaxID=670054 RepID=A0A7Z0EEV0_9MICO|nr:ABC transporter permease/substrate binding protein [Leifsonia psychrotolerans]NYJ19652.1 glycine betaine/proline transport system substrate-binding protein [Leifsonia psychrotolerans]
MTDIRLPIGTWAEAFVQFITDIFQPVFNVISALFGGFYEGVALIFQSPPFWILILVIAALGVWARGWLFGAGTVVGLGLIVGVDQWSNAMDTLALVLVAAIIAIVISVPLGILAARSGTASKILKPVLDFMQTMPAFVYLIPALILFRVGVVPGIVATIIFSLAPGVRMTELGIRGVDKEVVEAGHAFGASPRRILRQIQLPLAAPTIMAGVNQVIMLSLSMVVIAGMVGAGGLGGQIVQALSRIDVGLGFEAGLAVVILAILLDRLTAALGAPRPKRVSAPSRRLTRGLLVGGAVVVVAALGVAGFTANTGATAAGPDNGDKKTLTLAVFNGWPEGEAASYLWKDILEKKGYTVDLEYADAGTVFTGLSTGDYDLVLDSWLPTTHEAYMEKYGDTLVDLGSWNNDAANFIAVNADAPIDSLDDLAAHADLFDNKIIGIEPGAGLTNATEKNVIPGYGLQGMDFITSSTPAMLSELKAALASGENIAVTLWSPHWAYDEFDLKNLADPKGALGTTESIHSIGSLAFTKDFPTLAGWIGDFTLDSDLLYSLENVMFNGETSGDYAPIVAEWISKNEDYVDGLTN